MRKINNGFEFRNMEEYVEYFNLYNYVKYKTSGEKKFGHMFEEHVFKMVRDNTDAFIRKTYPDHDVLKGADLKFVFDSTSVLVDIKLNKVTALKNNKYYLDNGLMFSEDENDLYYFPLTKGLEVGFALRDEREAYILGGYCKFKKPIVVAIFNSLDYRKDGIELFDEDAAREFIKYIYFLNENMIREKMPRKDVPSFVFQYQEEQGSEKCVRESKRIARRKRDSRICKTNNRF